MKQIFRENADYSERTAGAGDRFKNGSKSKIRMIRRNFFLLIGVFAVSILSFAQNNGVPVIKGTKGLEPIKGGPEGKTYAVIIRTELSKKALVDTVTSFLVHAALLDKSMVNLDDINEETSEYILPITIRLPVFMAPGMMGLKFAKTPVRMTADLRFEFHDNGKVMLVVQNLDEIVFRIVNKEWTGFLGDEHKYYEETYPAYKKYCEEGSGIIEGTLLQKILTVMVTGVSGYSEYLQKVEEYFGDINQRYEVYNELVNDAKIAVWMTDKELIAFAEMDKMKYSAKVASQLQVSIDVCKQAVDEGGLLEIGKSRWEKNVRVCLDLLFKGFAAGVNGQIEGVAEDGEQTYINIDGTVLPVDPKWKNKTPPTDAITRERYIKKNKAKAY